MKKISNIILKVLLVLLLIPAILGSFGIFPAPTPDMYNTREAFDFINVLMSAKYVTWMMSVVFAICIAFILKNKMALVALLLLPITLNIVGFHLFLDGGLFTSGAIMGNILLIINFYFLYQNKSVYKALLTNQ